jgi:hypothetical protein
VKSIEEEKNEWLEVVPKGFSRAERIQLLGRLDRLIKNNAHFAQGDR